MINAVRDNPGFLDLIWVILDFPKFKKSQSLNKPGYPKHEPVMFDIDLFGGKNVPRTKYQKSDTLSGLHGVHLHKKTVHCCDQSNSGRRA